MIFDSTQWIAAAGHDPVLSDTNDLDVAAVIQARADMKALTFATGRAIYEALRDVRLSELGQTQAAQKAATEAATTLRAMGQLGASRKELDRRLAASPVPSLDTIPGAMLPMLHAALVALDPLERPQKVLDWLAEGESAPAILVTHASGPLALVDKTNRQRVADALRRHGNGHAAASAAALAAAIDSAERAAKAAAGLVEAAAGIKHNPQPYRV